ncbi:MAG: type II secretion system F family protein [Candidatus Eisenbacteria bacterium]|nr:type II secretion system F family protein [Candidatus Eisenbacteria bacterium]
MPAYQYKARERGGEFRAGVLEAPDEAEALRLLEQQALLPVRIAPADAPRAAAGPKRPGFFRKRVKPKDLITYTRQLETLLESGISLTQSLAILADQTSCEPLRDATRRVQEAVEQGQSFAEALEAEPGVFPPLYVSMLRAGEEGGVMADMLERTATLLEQEAETNERIRSATFYPNLVIVELLLAFAVLVKFVLPRYAVFFRTLGADLPLPTRMMLAVSDVSQKYGAPILGGLIVAAVAAGFYVRTPAGRWHWHMLQIRMPIFGEIVLKSILSRFARILAALLNSGTPITTSLDIVRRTMQNVVLEKEVLQMRDGIISGQGVSGTMKDSRVFPPLVVKMLAVGEETGSLDKMLLKISSYYDRDVSSLVKNLATAIEPVLLVVMGVAVLFFALAVFMPMWNLMGAVRH